MTEPSQSTPPEPEFDRRQLIKLAIEMGPLVAFFVAYMNSDIITATGVLMAATLISLAASRYVLGHVAMMPIVTAVLVCVFGALTLWLQDPRFIKMKPTILYLLFSGVLFGGLLAGKLFLKQVFSEAFQISEEGWRKLTIRWASFFIVLALANELIWRNFPEEIWVKFKVFGFLPLTMAFALAQMGLIKRHDIVKK